MDARIRRRVARRFRVVQHSATNVLRKLQSQNVRRALLIVAVIGFVGGIIASIYAQPEVLHNLQWLPVLLLASVAVPLTIFFNSLEFQLSARLIGSRIPFSTSLETTIIGSAANMLPIPGSTLVRVAALQAAGASLRHGVSTTLYVAVIWLGVASVFAGGWVLSLGNEVVGGAFVIVGAVILIAAFWATLKLLAQWQVPLQIVLVKLALVSIDSVRIYLCLWALNLEAIFPQAASLTVTSVLGSAVSIAPAGLGVREAIAAALGPVVALPASSAFLAISLSRLVGLALLVPLAIRLTMRTNVARRPGESASTADDQSIRLE